MEHRKLDALMSPMERIARVAAAGVSSSRAQQTSPSGAISLDNADGTRTIIGEVSNGEENPSYTMATHVGDTTPPGVPTGITATSRSGVVVVEWDGTLSGGIPDDFFCVRIYLDGTELGALGEAGSVASAKLESGTTHSITATSEDDCCLPDGTPAHNVSDATQAISVTVAKDASEVMADIDEQIEGVEQEIADFKSNTYTKAQTDKLVEDTDEATRSFITTNYTNNTDLATNYATKTLVSQTKEEIELSASQTYANKGAGNPNLSPFYAHDFSDVRDATANPGGYWQAAPTRATQLDDGWAHIVMDNSSGTGTMYAYMRVAPDAAPAADGTMLVEVRNLMADVTDVEGHKLWWNPNSNKATQQVYGNGSQWWTEDGSKYFEIHPTGSESATYWDNMWFGINKGHRAEFDARISFYANTEATIDGQAVTLPYEGSFKPYVTDQQALGKTYATNSALTVGLDGIRQEVASKYQSIDAMGAYSTTAEMNTAIQTSATGIEQSVAATYSTKQATADAIAAIQVGGRNLITLAETVNGYVNANTGNVGTPGTPQERTSGFIPVTAGETYICQSWCDVTGSQAAWASIAWYDSDKTYISRPSKTAAAGEGYALCVQVAPANAAYARAGWRTYGNGRGKLEQATTPTDYTAAPEDLVARPNLTPFGSHDLADVYDATTNPNGYWRQRPASAYVTQLADGWLHFERANSGTGVVGSSMQIRPIPGVEPGELLTVLIEVRNNQSTAMSTTGNFDDIYVQQGTNFQLWGTTVQSSSLTNIAQAKPLSALGESFEMRFTKVVDSEHKTGDYICGFALNVRNGAGQTLSFDFRVSVYRGGYGGGYVPYSIEDTTLSKTYTKSSTFTQTVNGLDGRITATEDGITLLDTLIRLFQGGVLTGYVGNAVSALMNAAGSFDVVQTTWQDGEPTIVGTLASFGANIVEIGKNSASAIIDFCAGMLHLGFSGNTGRIVMPSDYDSQTSRVTHNGGVRISAGYGDAYSGMQASVLVHTKGSYQDESGTYQLGDGTDKERIVMGSDTIVMLPKGYALDYGTKGFSMLDLVRFLPQLRLETYGAWVGTTFDPTKHQLVMLTGTAVQSTVEMTISYGMTFVGVKTVICAGGDDTGLGGSQLVVADSVTTTGFKPRKLNGSAGLWRCNWMAIGWVNAAQG